jgi:Zn-dependent protease
MNNTIAGAIPIFRIAGIQVYLHWSWLLVAYFQIVRRVNPYQSISWNIIEYLALFGIVLLHEFGHALACRQVGGIANRIMLWPLGGVAFAQPPPRPGATLWTIAAGPLVNVVLVPITMVAYFFALRAGIKGDNPDFVHFLLSIMVINIGLLVFNLLPIYPLDGGQILQALLWFLIGQARSLMAAGILGLVAAGGVLAFALLVLRDTWLVVVALFIAWQAWRGFRVGMKLQQMQPTLDLMNQGQAAFKAGNYDEAIELFSQVIESGGEPGVLATALSNRGLAECRRGRWQHAIEDQEEALRLQPHLAGAHNNLAWLLSTCPVDSLRDGEQAVEHALWACKATGWAVPACVGTLAAAYAESGDFGQAVLLQERALADPAYCRKYGEEEVRERLRLYEQGLPYRLPVHGG